MAGIEAGVVVGSWGVPVSPSGMRDGLREALRCAGNKTSSAGMLHSPLVMQPGRIGAEPGDRPQSSPEAKLECRSEEMGHSREPDFGAVGPELRGERSECSLGETLGEPRDRNRAAVGSGPQDLEGQ